jgi:hypothetical protein
VLLKGINEVFQGFTFEGSDIVIVIGTGFKMPSVYHSSIAESMDTLNPLLFHSLRPWVSPHSMEFSRYRDVSKYMLIAAGMGFYLSRSKCTVDPVQKVKAFPKSIANKSKGQTRYLFMA